MQNYYRDTESSLAKIINNFSHFSQIALSIRSKKSQINKFILNTEQLYIDQILQQQKKETGKVRAIILKGRQIGSTTYLAARGYHFVITNKGSRAFVLAHRQSATNNIFDIILRYHAYSPDFLKPQLLLNRNKILNFNKLDSSYVFSTAGGNEVGRSDTIQFFHGSEVAYWMKEENHLASALVAVPDHKGTEIILESTSNGPKGMFYEICLEALKEKSEFKLIFLPWYWHKEYAVAPEKVSQFNKDFLLPQGWQEYGENYQLSSAQLYWAYLKNKMLNINSSYGDNDQPCARFYQEFPASVNEAFKFSKSNTFISANILQKITYSQHFEKYFMPDSLVQVTTFNNLETNALEIIKSKFQQDKIYYGLILGVDIARGGGDYSWVIDKMGRFLGFNINEKIDLNDIMAVSGWLLKHIIRLNPIKVCIDSGGGGIGVYDRLKELGYEKILVLVNFGAKAFDSRKYLNKRAEMWGKLKEFIEDNNFIINDPLLLSQISALEYNYTSKGQIQLEAKSNLKMRLKHSPDGADAAALTFALEGGGSSLVNPNNFFADANLSNDFNPFDW
ncbi:hypothetical protein ABSA28_00972 [Candidatus Hepatincolaceae symbiont of Richtersius coronifer]